MHNAHVAMGKHALIFGASGITGWAVVNELLSDSPDAQNFDRVTALTVRPLKSNESHWISSRKLNIVDGIDLSSGTSDDVIQTLKTRVNNIESVTHVFFHSTSHTNPVHGDEHKSQKINVLTRSPIAYKWVHDPKVESVLNSSMLEKATVAVEALCPGFEFLVLPTGTKVRLPFLVLAILV